MLTDVEHDGVDATVWRILRATYLALILDGTGTRVEALTEPEQNLVLEPHLRRLEHDVKMIGQVLIHATAEAVGRFQQQLHAAPGLDHEMVDEAVTYAVARKEEDP